MAHELMPSDDYYANKRESLDDLDDSVESAWNQVEAKEREHQIADDYLAGEHDRAGTSDDDKFEVAYDASVIRKDREAARAAAAAGNPPDRPASPVSKKAADNAAYEAHLSREWDKRAGTPAKPAEARPEAAPPQPGGISPEDRAALAKAPPEVRAVIDREVAAHRETYAPVDALAGKWSGALAERGAGTAAAQVQHIDSLLETEHRLLNGSNEEKIAAMQDIARAYGVGAPSGAPAPQMQAHPAQMQAPPAPPQTGDALTDQLQRSHHEQQMEAWRQAIPAGAQDQRLHRAQQHVAAVATETTADGKLARPYFREVQAEMARAIVMAQRSGREPNLAAIYDAAVASRPDIQQHKIENAHATIRNFASENPAVFDPTIRARMNTIAAGHHRTGRPGDMKAILDEALRREPIIAAKYQRQVAQAKARGHKVEATLDQSLEAAYAAGVGL